MPSLPGRTNPETWREKYERLVTEYMIKRDASLELYPSVIDTLKIIKSSGTNIVAYTESMELYTLHRLRILGLDGLIDRVYTPSNHIYPNHLTTEQEKRVKAAYESARLKKTISCHTPPGELKPNPQLLLRIIDDMKGDLDSTIYIGDNPYKDIAMAQAAQVTDVFARYGSAHNRDTYELLRAVTHWSPSDVDKEKRLHEPGNMNPTHVLESGFKELLSLFSFSGAAA
jgi:phosphoglycolate phosphatase